MKLAKRIAPVALIILLQGCVITSDVYLADGSKGHNINCGGTVLNYSDCLAKAGEICGEKGYSVVNREGSAAPFSMAGGGFSANPQAASGSFSGSSGAVVTRNLFIKCNAQVGASSKPVSHRGDGWRLLVAPWVPGQLTPTRDNTKPIEKWERMSAHDTAKDCEDSRERLVESFEKKKDSANFTAQEVLQKTACVPIANYRSPVK